MVVRYCTWRNYRALLLWSFVLTRRLYTLCRDNSALAIGRPSRLAGVQREHEPVAIYANVQLTVDPVALAQVSIYLDALDLLDSLFSAALYASILI